MKVENIDQAVEAILSEYAAKNKVTGRVFRSVNLSLALLDKGVPNALANAAIDKMVGEELLTESRSPHGWALTTKGYARIKKS